MSIGKTFHHLDIPRPFKWKGGDNIVLDIEAVKVKAPDGWPVKTRFQTVVVGIGFWNTQNECHIVQIYGDDEYTLMCELEQWLRLVKKIHYYATREFDRKVLEGTWVSSRRAHSETPGEWPNFYASEARWNNFRPNHKMTESLVSREGDITGKDCLTKWKTDPEKVLEHNRLDVEELCRYAGLVGGQL